MPPLLLASTSPHRKALLQRFGLEFRSVAPFIDEAHRIDETPLARANRLALAKARAVANHEQGAHVVIGSDQVAHIDGNLLDKPETHARAVAQLQSMSGRRVEFLTAVSIIAGQEIAHDCIRTLVTLRRLSDDEIQRYIAHESVLDCAASIRCEGLGITLFETIETPDPTALIGLPLMATARILRQIGFALP